VVELRSIDAPLDVYQSLRYFIVGGFWFIALSVSLARVADAAPTPQVGVAAASQFRLDGRTYASQEEFIKSGRRCGTVDLSKEVQARCV
jgi:hypothetical protein